MHTCQVNPTNNFKTNQNHNIVAACGVLPIWLLMAEDKPNGYEKSLRANYQFISDY